MIPIEMDKNSNKQKKMSFFIFLLVIEYMKKKNTHFPQGIYSFCDTTNKCLGIRVCNEKLYS